MTDKFPGSINMAHILEAYGWGLYDITTPPPRIECLTWEEIEEQDPAPSYLSSHKYIFLPERQEDETLQKAYARSMKERIYPALIIPHTEKPAAMLARNGYNDQECNYYFLNQVYFYPEKASFFSDPCLYLNYPSTTEIPSPLVAEIFSRYFALTQFIENKIILPKMKRDFVN